MDTDPRDETTPRTATTRAGRYEVVRPIGEGGMAQVFLCVHRGPGGFEKRIVMKVLRDKFVGDDEYIRMFLDEASLLSRIQHPNIVDVFEVDCVDGVPYLLMAYVNGPTLGRLHQRAIRMDLYDLGCFLTIVLQVCQALHHAHTLRIDGEPGGVVHRDVSSQNILIDGESGIVKLIDFGIAKTHNDQVDTDVRIIKGKIPYMAPEVLQGERADARADLYAVGVLLYRIVTNRQPVQEGEDARAARLGGRSPRASELAPWISPELDDIIDRALQPDPWDRYQTAAELAIDLQAEIDQLGTHPTRMAEWLAEVYPNGEEDWTRRLEEGALAGSVHPSLNRLVTRNERTPEPTRAPNTGRTAAIAGAVAALLVVLATAAVIGCVVFALRFWGEPVTEVAAEEPAATYLAAAAELLAQHEVDAARVMNRMADERGATDPNVVLEIARQRAEIERQAALAPAPTAERVVAASTRLPGSSLPARPPRVRVAPVENGAQPPDVAPPPGEAEEVPPPPEVVAPPEDGTAAAPTPPPLIAVAPVAQVGPAIADRGGLKGEAAREEVGVIKVFRQAELEVKTRSNLKYPVAARALDLGDQRCLAQVFIDEQGVPYDVVVHGCPAAFFEDTRKGILQWRWYPPKDDHGTSKAQTTLAVTYRM